MNEVMRDVEVNNLELLEYLNGWKDYLLDNYDEIDRSILKVREPKVLDDLNDEEAHNYINEHYCNEKYLNEIKSQGQGHSGFPDVMYSIQLKMDQLNWLDEADHTFKHNYIEKFNYYQENIMMTLGVRKAALNVLYPRKKGFIGWHNNANASAYNLIFTWSENGDGYWQHLDPHTNELVTVPDKAGWQCKAFYFGAYIDDPEKLVYHQAKTNDSLRLTLSFVFDRKNEEFWLDAIEEVESA